MLKRIPEAELMLDSEQARAYAGADFEEAHQSVVTHIQRCFSDLPEKARVIDLGCGPCDVTRRVALAFPGWSIDAVDGSAAMLELGRDAIERAGLAERVRLHHLRFPTDALREESYAVVLSNSVLHHLSDPATLWQMVRRLSAVGGNTFVMDLARPPNTSVLQQLLRGARSEPEVLQRDFHNSLLAAYTPEEVRAQLDQNGLGHFRVERVSDRHLIAWGQL